MDEYGVVEAEGTPGYHSARIGLRAPRSSRTCTSTRDWPPTTWVPRPALLAEVLELAPYRKFLYSPDAFGLPELYYLGVSALFHRALSDFLAAGLQEDLDTERTVARLTRMLCAENARRAYRLGDQR